VAENGSISLNNTTRPVDSEEEGRSSTMDRQKTPVMAGFLCECELLTLFLALNKNSLTGEALKLRDLWCSMLSGDW